MPKLPAYDLTDAELRDLTELLRAKQPLPEKYRFLLFEDKREVELVWNGKTRDVCTTVLPFQTLEHVDEPRAETKVQGDLFDARGRQTRGWTNKLIWGDNKLILSSLKAGPLRRQIEDAGGLKLIYIDPPFDVGADFSMDIAIGGETFHKQPNLLEQIAYRDTWGRGADSFISMIYERLILMRDLLAENGSIYVHCDWRVNAYIRLALDEVFGAPNFLNQISWKRYAAHSLAQTSFDAVTDTVLVYGANAGRATHNPQFGLLSGAEMEKRFPHVEEKTGRRFQHASLEKSSNASSRDEPRTIGGDVVNTTLGWIWSQATFDERLAKNPNLIYWTSTDRPRYKIYADEYQGAPLGDIWTDIGYLSAGDSQRLGYPTQKPEALLERIIQASSNEGDLVADFFAGSGTTAAVAEKLGRKWIATDLGKFAIHTTRKRLIGVQRELKAADKNFRAFEVLNLGRYERQAYLNVGGRLSPKQREAALQAREREFRDLILRAYKAEAFDNDAFFDGTRGNRLVVIGPINLPVGRLFVEEVITECRKRGATRCDVLAFEFEMGLFPAVLDEAKAKGIDLTPKQIPPEVFDKRAVDKGQVVFFDISFIEATPRYAKGKSARDKLTLRIELTDFSVYYTQGVAEAALAAMKNGKSEVICDQGRLIKVGKDKDGVVRREVLTKHWTDWVDYWAVDFDYQSRKEIISVPAGGDVGAAMADASAGETAFENKWTGSYIFENEWQSFRTRKQRELELTTAEHRYDQPGRYTVAVKVIDIFGNDTMTLVPVNLG